jgi:hypothetical protein
MGHGPFGPYVIHNAPPERRNLTCRQSLLLQVDDPLRTLINGFELKTVVTLDGQDMLAWPEYDLAWNSIGKGIARITSAIFSMEMSTKSAHRNTDRHSMGPLSLR